MTDTPPDSLSEDPSIKPAVPEAEAAGLMIDDEAIERQWDGDEAAPDLGDDTLGTE